MAIQSKNNFQEGEKGKIFGDKQKKPSRGNGKANDSKQQDVLNTGAARMFSYLGDAIAGNGKVGHAELLALGLEALCGEGDADLYLRAVDGPDEGVFADHGVEDAGHRDGCAGFVGCRLTEAVRHDALHIEGRMVGRVVALNGPRFLFAEPIALAALQLCHQLGVQLVVVDGAFVVNELPCRNFDAEEAA